MVNAEKHRKLKEMQLVDIYIPGAFESWLKDFYGSSRKESFAMYWGGINGIIHKKLENWNPKEDTWFKHDDGLLYSNSYNEIMELDMCYTFIGTKSRGELLWNTTQNFLKDINISSLFIDAEDYFEEMFDVFKIFEEVKQYDIVFIKNMTQELQMFLMDFGIQQCVEYVYFFLTEEESEDLMKFAENEWNHKKGIVMFQYEPLSKREGKIGFELYDNLKEWKKEVTAPTRNDPEYRAMKKRVRERDNYTCQCCGYHNTEKVNHGLEVHHIYGYKDHLDYRIEDSNCVTLCNDCHKKYHSIYGKNNVTPFTFTKFIRDYNTYTQNQVQTTFDDVAAYQSK